MTALTRERIPGRSSTVLPARQTVPAAADVKVFMGALVCLNAAGAGIPGNTIANGALVAAGVSSATFDNTDGDAGDIDLELETGTFPFVNDGSNPVTAAHRGQPCYVVDDQTVSSSSSSGTRCYAGMVDRLDAQGRVHVTVYPWLSALLRHTDAAIAAAIAAI